MTWVAHKTKEVAYTEVQLPIQATEGAEITRNKKVVVVRHDQRSYELLKSRGMLLPPPVKRYGYPGRFKPMQHQKETVEFLVNNPRSCCTDPIGSGKTNSALWAMDYLVSQGCVKRTLIVAPVSVRESVWMNEIFLALPKYRAALVAGPRKRKQTIVADENLDIVITNPDSLHIIKEYTQDIDLIIFDECFTAGTEITTDRGQKPIEDITQGDVVQTDFGYRRVTRTGKRLVHNNELVILELGNGKRIECTKDHPIFTERGWVCAGDCEGERLLDQKDLSDLRSGVFKKQETGGMARSTWCNTILRQVLRSEREVGNPVHKNEKRNKEQWAEFQGAPPMEQGAGVVAITQKESISSSKGERSETDNSGRKWERDEPSRKSIIPSTTKTFYLELPYSIGKEAARLSYLLQGRLWRPETEIGNRSAGKLPSNGAWEGTGREKEGQAGGTRVERVIHREPGGVSYVYNLTIEKVPTFFAGGYLVHNCTDVKTVTTRRWKALRDIAKGKRLWLMTGTPTPQAPTDAYGLYKLITPEPKPIGFLYFKDLTMKKVSQFRWETRENASETVAKLLQPAIRHTPEQCTELPEKRSVTRDVPLTGEQKTLITRFKQEAQAEINGERIQAFNAAAVLTKTLQVMAGGVYNADRETRNVDASPLFEAVDGIIKEADGPVLVFVSFRSSVTAITQHLIKSGHRIAEVHGGTKHSDRTKAFATFQAGGLDAIVAVASAMSHGVTLTRGRVVVWVTPPSASIYEQANGRVHRKGQKNSVIIYNMTQNTLSSRLFNRLQSKIQDQETLLSLLKQELL